MLNEEIRRHIKSQPFVPFEIELVAGRVVQIRHPDFVLLPPLPRAPFFFWVDEDGVGETVNTNLVVAVRPIRSEPRRRKAG